MKNKEKKIRLSIVVPCYRVEQYLPRCLDSLLAQSLKEIEIICINDGSPDNSLSVLKDYREKYGSRIRIIDKKNEGVWKARRDGILAASGEYTGFVDPDDYVREDYAKKLYEAAVKWNADIACCGYDRIDMESGRRYSREMTRFRYEAFDIRKDPGLMLEVNVALWNKIFRSEMIKRMYDIRHIPEALDDYVFTQLIYINAGIISFVSESLVCYMIRSGSVVNSVKPGIIRELYAAAVEARSVYEKNRPQMLAYADAAAFLNLGISLMHRLSGEREFRLILRRNTAFLDRMFPGWRHSPYITLGYVAWHRGANRKILTIRWLYRLRLFRIFLAFYGFMINHLKIDIKW